MQYNRLTSETALADALKNLDKRISTVETKGTGTIGFVGSDGVELRIGKNPDGTVGVTPFIGDTTPPPVATAPIASSGPGFITVVWDGLFVNDEAKPADFEHLNVIGRKIVGGIPQANVAVGMIRATLDSCLVGTDIAAPGDTWEFIFTSEDYNNNVSVESAPSGQVVQKSFAADALITDALDGLAQDYISAQSAAASAQQAANAAQSAANQNALDITKKGTVYTQSVQPAADMNGLWIDKGHNNIPRRYLGYRKALFVNVGGGASVGSRLTALGSTVTTVTAMPTVDEASQYDIVAFDAGYAGLGSSYGTLASSLLDRGVSVFTSGNDTTNLTPLFTGSGTRGTPKNPIRPVGTHPAATGWTDYSDNDLNFYLTGVRPDATVTGVTLVTSLGTDQPLNIVWEHPTTFARWAHVETYASPVSVLNAHLNWIADNWVAIQDQAVVASIAAAQLKADQAFNNAATAATAAGNAQTTADNKNRSWYQDDQPAGTSHKVGDTWYDTNDGYKLRTWTGSIWQTTQDSALAQITAESKGRTYTQNTVPPVEARNDKNLWIDTSAGVGLYVTKYWEPTANSGAGAWTALKDKDAAAAQTTADSKGETIYSDTEPAVAKRLPQNTWVDTTGGVNIQKRWFNNAWTPTVDSRIPSTAAAVTAVSSKVDTVSALAEAKGTYTQSVAPPVAARLPQTIWNDTSLGLDKVVTKYWDGTANAGAGAWVAVSEKAATDAKAVADAKGETIYSDSAPSADKQLPQNTWVDTTGGINIQKRWVQGSGWVIAVDSRIPSTAAAVTAVDTRVTGVSAAASAAVGTVDSRVTSVSAAASGQISTVDSRVTGVSAAAAAGISTVDARVSSVSASLVTADDKAQDALDGLQNRGGTLTQSFAPAVEYRTPNWIWIDTSQGVTKAVTKYWDGTSGQWTATAEKAATDAAAAVTVVDGRVTSVSASVTSVDSRVTGVSAAASSEATAKANAASASAIQAQAYSNNASFDDWTGTYPVGFSAWSTAPTKETSIVKRAPFSVRFNVPDATAQHGMQFGSILSHAGNLEFFTVEVDLYLVSGTLDGSGMILDWNGMSNNRAQINFVSEITGVQTGKWYRISKVLRRPTNATGTWTSMGGYLMGQWSGHGTGAAKNIIYDWFNIRPSTFEEILSYKAPTTQDLSVVDGRVTSVSASVTSVDARVTGVSAAAGSAISTVDGRVSSVSASVTSVDSRVTGVSATASSQITQAKTDAITTAGTNADSKITAATPGILSTAATTAQTKADAARDAAINDATAKFANKSKTYFQTAKPTGGTYLEGDVWIDSDDGNKIYVYKAAPTNDFIVAQDAAIDKAIYSTFPTDIDTGAVNKWLFTKYNKTTTANWTPQYSDIVGFAGTSSLINDAASMATAQGDQYIGQLRTIVNVVSSKTVTLTATHDDGARVYVDGVSVYSSPVFTSNAAISFSLSAGWHVIDFFWAEQSGGDGWSAVSPLLSSQVTSMFAPVSNSAVASMANTALLSANGKNKVHYATTDASGTTDSTDGNRPFIDGDTWYKRSTTSPYNILGIWEFAGGSWTPRKMDGATLSEVNAGTITVGQMHGDRIQANTVATTKLAVGDFNNLFDNGRFTMGTDGLLGWNSGSGTVVTDATAASGKAMAIAGLTGSYPGHYQTRDIPFGPGEQVRVKAMVKRSATANSVPSVRTMFLDAAKAMLSNAGVGATVPAADTWGPLAGKTTAPAGTAFVRLWVEYSGVTGSTGYVTDLQAYRMNAGELMVDGALDAFVITGPTIQTETAGSRGIKLTSSEFAGYDASGNKNFSLTSAGALSLKGSITSGSSITGATITGGLLQTEVTPSRGIKIDTTEMAGYDASGNKNFSLTTGGTLALRGTLQSGSSIQGASVTASGIYTNASATAGVKLADTGIKAYNGSGNLTFHLDSSTGLLEVPGIKTNSLKGDTIVSNTISVDKLLVMSTDNLISEPTFLGGGVSWGSMTGGYSIDPVAARNGGPAFKIANSASQQGRYNLPDRIPAEGGQSYRISAWVKSDVAIPLDGITLYITTRDAAGASSVLGVGKSVATAANTWVKISGTRTLPADAVNVSFGVFTESSFSTGNVWVDFVSATRMSNGELIVDGSIDGKSITGATLTGGLIQTDNTAIDTAASRGVKLTTSGLFGYDNTGTKTFNLSNTGALTLKGNILSGSTITGAQLAAAGGGIVTSNSANTGIKITDTGIKAYGGGALTFNLDATTGMLEVPGIKTNSLKGDTIQTASLTADKLLVSDFTNLLDDASIVGTGWTKGSSPASASVVFDGNEKTNTWRFNAATAQVDVVNKNVIPVNTILVNGKPTDQFWLSARTYSTLNVDGYLRVLFTNDAGAQVGYSDITIPPASGWATRSMDIGGVVTYPTGTKFLKVQPIIGANATSGYILYGSMVLRRKNGGELLVDGALDAKTITGSLIQTDNTPIDTGASRGIKLTSSGLFGYDGSGNKNFNLASNGSLTLTGTIKTGSTIEGALLTGTTGIQTSTGATSGVKVTNTGIKAWDGSNNLTFNLDASTGYLELPGLKANSINGDRLVSGSVTSEQVRIGDFSNHFINGFGELGAGKGFGTNLIYDTTDKPAGVTGVFKSTAGQGNYTPPVYWIDVTPNTEYITEVWLKASLPNSRIYIELRDQAGAHGTTNVNEDTGVSEGSYPIADEIVPTTWTKYTIKTTTTATATRLKIGVIYFNHVNGTERNAVVSLAMGLRRRLAGSLIVDGAITTDHMTSGTIDGGVIKAGSLTSTEIKARSITTGDLVVTSMDNLIVEADFGNLGSSWDLTPAYKFIMPDRGRGGLPALRIVGGTVEVKARNLANKISVDDNSRYRAAISVRSTEALAIGKVKMYLKYYTSAADTGTELEVFSNNAALVPNTWKTFSGITPALPAGTIAFEVIVSAQNSDSLTWTEIDYVSLTRAMDAQLVVDGSITAAKIAAESIEAKHLTANSITASAISASSLWTDASWLGVAGASSLTLKSAGTPTSAIYTYTDDAGNNPSTGVLWNTPETAVSPAGLHIYNIMRDANGVERDRKPIVKLGHFTENGVDLDDDYFSIDKAGIAQITMNSEGELATKKLFIGDAGGTGELLFNGDDIGEQLRRAPRGIVAWGQFTGTDISGITTLGSTGGDIGMFEIGWDTSQDNPDRMYNVTMAPMLVNLSNVNTTTGSTVGMRMWMTTDGTRPAVGVSQIVQYQYVATKTNGYQTLHMPTKLVSSSNGNYIRVLFSLYANCGADVYDSQNVTILVNDLGEYPQESGIRNTSGGQNGVAPAPAPPATVKTTRTAEWGYNKVKSWYGVGTSTPAGAQGTYYNYNTTKAYQGLSPAGYGNLSSMFCFPDTITSTIAGSTINGVWVYVYFEHWYNASGGKARIRFHTNTNPPTQFNFNTTNGMDSASFPRASGRWVAVPSSIWPYFLGLNGTTFKGFSLWGDGTYGTYGIANNARIRIKYTK